MTKRYNDSEREQWVMNHEGLYNWWRTEMRGERKLREFVRSHRAEIDAVINGGSASPNTYPLGYMQGRGAS